MNCEEVRADLVAWIRDELDFARANDIAQHLQSCSACAEEQAELEETMTILVLASPAEPPANLRSTVMTAMIAENFAPELRRAVPGLPPTELKAKTVAAARRDQPGSIRRSSRLSSFRPREIAFAAAATVAIVFASVTWLQLQDARRSTTGAPSEEGIPRGHNMQSFVLKGDVESKAGLAHYRHDNYRLILSTAGYEVTPPGFQYSVWLRGPQGDVPLGGFRLKRQDDFTVPFAIAVDPVQYPQVVVTLEPLDGSPALDGEVVNSATLDVRSVHHGEYEE